MITKRKTIIFLATCLLLICASMLAQCASVKNPGSGYEQFIEARDLYFNEAADYAEIETIFTSGLTEFDKLEEGFAKFYWQAQSYYIMGEMAETRQDTKVAAKRYAKSQELVMKALEYEETNSEGVRLLSETYMKLMNYKGFFYKMQHGTKISELPKKAIELDNNNYKAHIALSLFYIFAPSMAGGDVDRAIEELNFSLITEDSFEKFLAYGWLGYAYNQKGLSDLAKEYVKRALEIYPNNLWANSILTTDK